MVSRCYPLSVLVVLAGAVFGGAEPPAPKDKEELKLSENEQTILDLTNEARARQKLPPLKANATLFKVARAHSANMAKQGQMKHVLDDKTPSQRVKAAGYNYAWTGENIAFGQRVSVETVFQGWMDSPGHKANILKDKYKEIGIGSARADDGKVYYTQVFGTKKR